MRFYVEALVPKNVLDCRNNSAAKCLFIFVYDFMKRSVTFRLRWILWFLLWNFYVGKTGCYSSYSIPLRG